ncbi:RsfA family transcriptional regulator [Metabacillus rhizolycopersici]|uniref:RsfA family transcriptional regulator n=1 Tax=Metabacillus rhizolycopersici TaxID=2875709 RepID=UPI0027E000F6|nr:RsfA family transcriptional regulator [Metabacillus rhizolycopersici]
MKVRRDAWSHEDDLLLAETILRHIRDDSTQVAAFDEAGDELNRTSAACGYRWNAEVRTRYVDAVEIAKKQRKERKRTSDQKQRQKPESQTIDTKKLIHEIEQDAPVRSMSHLTLNFEDCITFLSTYSTKDSPELRSENNELVMENGRLKRENEELTLKYHQLIENRKKVIDEYTLLMSVFDQASTIEEKKYVN